MIALLSLITSFFFFFKEHLFAFLRLVLWVMVWKTFISSKQSSSVAFSVPAPNICRALDKSTNSGPHTTCLNI